MAEGAELLLGESIAQNSDGRVENDAAEGQGHDEEGSDEQALGLFPSRPLKEPDHDGSQQEGNAGVDRVAEPHR